MSLVLSRVKAAFNAMPHVNQIWLDRDGTYSLVEKKGCRVITRAEAKEFKDEEEKPEVKPVDQNERIEMQKMIEFLQAQNKELADKCNSANERNEKARLEHKELEDNNKTLQESLGAAEADLKDLTEKNQALTNEVSALGEQNKNLKEHSLNLETTIESLNKELKELKDAKS